MARTFIVVPRTIVFDFLIKGCWRKPYLTLFKKFTEPFQPADTAQQRPAAAMNPQ